MAAEIARSFSQLEQLKEAWDRLAASRPRPEVFHTFAWAKAWWEGYGREYEVFTPVIRDAGGEVVAIWPLVRRNLELRPLGDGASDHNDLLASPENAQAAFGAAIDLLAEHREAWKTGIIRNVSARGVLLEAARRMAGHARVQAVIVQAGKGWAAVAEDGQHFLRLARKDSLRRHRKRLERLGRVTFRHIENIEEIPAHLGAFQRQHIERWALKGVKSHFLDEASRRYYAALADHLSACGPLRFGVLEVEGRPAAYHLGFESAGRYVWYKPTFDVDLAESGPGEVLLQSVLQYCASANIEELDFTIGDEQYKSRFSNLTYDYHEIHLFSRRCAKQYLLRARERLKKHPVLYAWLRSRWNRSSEWLQRLGRALQRDGLAGFAGKRLRQLVRAFVFRRDEVIVYRLSDREAIRGDACRPDIEIAPLRFSLLAETALKHPEQLHPDRLRSFRERMTAGDRGFVALYRGHVAHIIWIGGRTEIVAGTETGPHCVLPLGREVSVIHDAWTPDEFRGLGIYKAALQFLARKELDSGREVWIYCLKENSASRAAICKTGFTETARMVRILWFGRIERRRITRRESSEANRPGLPGAG